MRERIERLLEGLGHFAFRHAVAILVGLLVVVAAGATRIPTIEIRTSMDDFLSSRDEVKAEYDAFLALFGRDDVIMIAIEPPDVFERGFLERLRALHEALEDEVPHLREVQSLVNARETRGVDDTLVVGELLEDWPETDAELADVRRRALANPLYIDLILSRDAKLTVVTVELEAFAEEYDDASAFSGFEDTPDAESGRQGRGGAARLTGAQEREATTALQAVVERFDAPDFRIHAGGGPVLNAAMMQALITNILLFTTLSTGMIALFLAFVFRRLVGVVIPLAVSLLSVLATVGFMGVFGIAAMPISEVVPSFLLATGVGASVHLIAIFQQRLEAGASREEAIAGALGHSGLPIVMTGLTTAGGIASFIPATLEPVSTFGVVASTGILICVAMTLLLTPALLSIAPMKSLPLRRAGDEPVSVRILTRAGGFAIRRAHWVLITSAALVLLAGIGVLRLRVSFDNLEWFPDDMPAKVASRKLDEKFGGAMTLELLVETPAPNGLHDPEVLHAMDRARHVLEGLQVGTVVAGRSVSLVDVLKEIHQALNGGRPEAYVVPDDRALISQELILFENSGSDDLEDVVDSEFRIGRMSLRLPFVDALHYPAFAAEARRLLRERLPDGVSARQTGLMMVAGRTFQASIETITRSYLTALAVITPLMMLLLGSFRLGLIAMLPNLFPIVLTLGLMGWTHQPLEMFSLLIGSIALGLAVDDTIHFMHGFRQRFAETADVATAVRDTLRTTGQALLFTSIVLSSGFLIYLFSELNNLTRFGTFTAFSIAMAFLADILLAPALMQVTTRWSSLGKRGR